MQTGYLALAVTFLPRRIMENECRRGRTKLLPRRKRWYTMPMDWVALHFDHYACIAVQPREWGLTTVRAGERRGGWRLCRMYFEVAGRELGVWCRKKVCSGPL